MLSIKNKIKSISEALLLGFDNFTGLHVSGSDINSPAISARISAGEPLNIAGHSHGGNVVKEYSNLPSAVKIDKLVTLGTPQRESYHINRSMVGSYINAYSKSDFVQANGAVLDSPGRFSSSTMDKMFTYIYGLLRRADNSVGNGIIDSSAKNIEVPGMSHSEMRSH